MKSHLLEEAQALMGTSSRQKGGKECGVKEFLDTLTNQERDAVEALIDNRDVYLTETNDLLKKFGVTISDSQLRKHRGRGVQRSSCKCPRVNL